MAARFQASLPTGFDATVSNFIKTMEPIRKGVKMRHKIFKLKIFFFRLLATGQQRQMKVGSIFQYELCPVPRI